MKLPCSPASCACALTLVAGITLPAVAEETGSANWALRRLFEPSPQELAREAQGHIVIYDGLTDTLVSRAMSEEFDRVQAMMFTETVVTDYAGEPRRDVDTGEVMTEDDGC